jgi:hypothetical protein
MANRLPLEHHPLLRLVLYYVALTIVCAVLWYGLPAAAEGALHAALHPLMGSMADGTAPNSATIVTTPQPLIPEQVPASAALMTLIAGTMAFALALPVSWVYMFTRQRKGYSQSVVQALVLMPVVIAVIAALVRNSLGLAFALAGLLTAVRFRTTLDDSKDAVFMFVVTAIGLASGVQLEVAVVLSLVFVVITLGLWFTDFARTPQSLEGTMAERRLARATAIKNRTSQFVARLDHEIIEGMAPQQLESLAKRIDKRRKDLGGDGDEEEGPRYDGRMRVTVADSDAATSAVEAFLEKNLKRWKQVRVDRSENAVEMIYAVRLKKGNDLAHLKAQVLEELPTIVSQAEVGAWI